ncbi:DUF3775 domain-containing protein [Siculibacillus lacustris]|uniref:DUF3775 domain-containing protein n=1 Tax=Siculibacillus lacustris TaxID=1549641 RepID=A0A4V6MZ00_9HYPH|nr:DUF3775 domain-containing protein [Siculibacillus lacustris]TBW34710.1 DUF3775 domain-containing protein [Siculibacillus lacustris]
MEIAVEKVHELVEYFRFLDAKSGDGDIEGEEEGSRSPSGHLFEDGADDGTEDQIRGVIEGLNVDEKSDLVALMWIGRGDFEAKEWPVAVRRAQERSIRNTARYLMGIPNVGDLIEEGLAAIEAFDR